MLKILGTNISFRNVIEHNIDDGTGKDYILYKDEVFAELTATGHLMLPLEIAILDNDIHLQALEELREVDLSNTICEVVGDLFLYDTEVAFSKETNSEVDEYALAHFWCDISSLAINFYTEKAKELLSNGVYKSVEQYCKATEFDTEEAFKDIIVHGVRDFSDLSINTLEQDLEKPELIEFIKSKMTVTFDVVAIRFKYTEYGV